ncbi:kinase-like domain-containing protein [Ochromonadaceae sp. CCMP2298]|nr:kinase-like domain-containing protein [Ochromonadaceae sp. CCMP2298]
MRDRLTVLCKLGMGASSAVYKALDLTDMRLVALKMIRVNESNKRDQLVRELRSLFELLREHSRRSSIHMPKKNRRPEKYIVDFYDAFRYVLCGVVSLMIEYMDGGSLQDIVDEGGCDDEPTLANIAVQALKGLLFLHENYQIHRDLKPGNFLISHRGEVKVADLGILKQLPEPTVTKGTFGGTKVHLPKTNTFVGTTTYMSPERIDGKEYSFPADVWAFGLSIVTMALGRFPIDTQGGYWTILHGIRDAPPPTLPNTFSPECRDFVASCMQRNPDDRKTVQELLKHPFLLKTVVEDLTYDQSYERGKIELLSIVDAVNVHIKSLVEDVAVRRDAGQFGEEQIRQFDRVYGDLIDSKPIEVLQRLFFGVGEDSKARQNSTPKGRERERVRRIRPRLTNLAKQLHLPVDKVEMEARLYIESLA